MHGERPSRALLVLRHGETFLKGANRRRFEQQLEENARSALRGLGEVAIRRAQGRCYADLPAPSAAVGLRRAAQVFGFSSVSLAEEVPSQLEGFLESTAAAARRLLAGRARPASFKVRARRSDKRFALTSPEINRRVGAKLAAELDLPVDLHHPELTIGVEVGCQTTFVFVERVSGAGGLPVGASGRALLLLSGGIDSPVAGHLAQKRGCRLRGIYFHSPPHTGQRALDKVERLAARLAQRQGAFALHVVRFTAVQERIRDRAPPELLVVLYRRAMMRIAGCIASNHRCGALVTGESLGQVASQTMANLGVIEQVTDRPVLRPLIAFDKQETIALAREIGTFEISTEPHLDCCSLFVPRHPATRVSPQRACAGEQHLDLDELVQRASEEATLSTIYPEL